METDKDRTITFTSIDYFNYINGDGCGLDCYNYINGGLCELLQLHEWRLIWTSYLQLQYTNIFRLNRKALTGVVVGFQLEWNVNKYVPVEQWLSANPIRLVLWHHCCRIIWRQLELISVVSSTTGLVLLPNVSMTGPVFDSKVRTTGLVPIS